MEEALLQLASQTVVAVVNVHGLNAGSHREQIKKKWGRPRKYSTYGSMSLALTTISPTSTASPGSAVFSSLSVGQPNADCNNVESVVDFRYSNMKNVSEAVDCRKYNYSKLFTEQQTKQSPAAENEVFDETTKRNEISFTSILYEYA
ncbi:hypothetical protein MA16_Dca004659 [Dendrobium catenatum]|uniref:Uncharacterized protein n=1 Tax=Dendrobium catenatum TaxID=906689 RepID=A0A2I0VGE4_9ASPA|nr:hypothetical protein MA16_Dca028379 [Dendrobium catenatum]PKU65044.1 hypothetical protein MA16_Dca004659 [Dendrobium catenatum]